MQNSPAARLRAGSERPSAGLTPAATQPPATAPRDTDPIEVPSAEEQLRAVVGRLARGAAWSASAGTDYQSLGSVLVFRPWPARSLHVVGDSLLAGEFRRLISAGAVPGWTLHPVPAGRTPLQALAAPPYRQQAVFQPSRPARLCLHRGSYGHPG
jgi:hypothetical protein